MHDGSQDAGNAASVRPLTRRTKAGEPYARPHEIEREIAAALDRPLARLLDPAAAASSQCLLYFARHFRPNGHSSTYDYLVTMLLDRIDKQVRGRVTGIPEHRRHDVRMRVRDEFLVRLAGGTDVLDIFEAKFALAIKTLTIDAIRHFERQDTILSSSDALVPADGDGSADDAVDAILFRQNGPALTQSEILVELERVRSRLSAKQYQAIIAVHYMGLKIEALDPDETTAATLMKVSGRRVRDYLREAVDAIAGEKEPGQ